MTVTVSPDAEIALIACHDCGLLYRGRALPPGSAAWCARCGAALSKAKNNSLERALMLNVTALLLFGLANAYPFMILRIEGREQVSTLFTGVRELYESGLWPLSALVFCASIFVPLLKILSLLYVLVPLRLGRQLPAAATVFRYTEIMHPWAMMEVYLLGVFVAIVNLADLGTIELGIAVYSFAALIVIMIASEAALNPREVWEKLSPGTKASALSRSALRVLLNCHSCQQISRIRRLPAKASVRCPRCNASLHRRKPDSINKTWALLVTAAILYVPANVYPIMTVISFGKGESDTILSGVAHMVEGGLWPLALLVFFASVTVPVLKILGLSFLLISVQRRSTWRPKDRTVLFRIIEAVGRWSMIDIFMISILVALVRLDSIATIEPGVGATAFAAVVMLTMIASLTFDPRLIWDAFEQKSDGHERARL